MELNQAGKVRRSGRAPVRTMAIAVRTNVQLSGSTIRTKSWASQANLKKLKASSPKTAEA